MKKILFFSSEPGGAEVLTPIIHLFQETGEYDLTVIAYGQGLSRFSANNIACVETKKIIQNDRSLINLYRPDMLITSATSLPEFDMSEKYLWENARQYGVKSMAFLDQWQNYTPRFSGPSATERLGYLPDFINCIDTCGRTEMLAEGFPETILEPFGQPYLSSLVERYRRTDVTAAKASIPGGMFRYDPSSTILFVSEAIREYFGRQRGYDQFDALQTVLESTLLHSGHVGVIVKLHPKEDRSSYQDMISQFPVLDIRIISNELTSTQTLCLADTIFGMTSMMLIEAFLLGKRVVSFQPGVVASDELVLSRQKLIPVVKDRRTVDIFDFPAADPTAFPVFFDTKKFLLFIKTWFTCEKEVHHDA